MKTELLPSIPRQKKKINMRERDELLTVDDLAGRLKMSKSWVRLRVYDKTLPVVRLGRRIRFVWPEVCKALGISTERED